MVQRLDITNEHCPMTFVKTKLKLANMNSGEQLDVLLRAGEPLDNVPRTAREEGHQVLGIQAEGLFYKVSIVKK